MMRIDKSIIAAVMITAAAGAEGQPSAPRLVVNIMIDQLRSDYLEAFAPLYSDSGFVRLKDGAARYTNVAYPFTPVDRASASAAFITGTSPYYNGITGIRWLNRETLLPVMSTLDAARKGLNTKEKSSPSRLMVSTVGDELKAATDGKAMVWSVTPNSDEALFLAGHAADGAIWIDDDGGYWCSSDYYYTSLPSWLMAYNDLYSPAKTIGSLTWEASNALVGNYSYFIGGGAQTPFKHSFKGGRRFRQLKSSGMVNQYVTDAALQCVRSTGMGGDGVCDMLSIVYYAGSFDHKPLGECRGELQDTYVRADKELARLMSAIERRVGKEYVLFVVTSTGYCDDENIDYTKYRVPGGSFNITRAANLLSMYFGALWGQGRYIEQTFKDQIYLNHKLLEQKRVSLSDATCRAQEFLAQLEGVSSVLTSLQLLTTDNELTRKRRNAFNAERCGDLMIEVAPGWVLTADDMTEKSVSPQRSAFIQFPLFFYGRGTKAGEINNVVTIDRIAPTVAKVIRIRAPNACSAEPLF